MFYDKYIELCTRIGKTPSAVAQEIGFNKASVTGWKKGSCPTDSNIQKIADFFNVPADYFWNSDASKKAKAPASDTGAGAVKPEHIRAAFFEGAEDLSKEELDMLWDDARSYMQYKLEQRRKQKHDK